MGQKTRVRRLKDFNIISLAFSENIRYARINGQNRVTGLADVEAALGYRFFQNDRFRVQGEVNVTVPTGTNVTGERMFEGRRRADLTRGSSACDATRSCPAHAYL